MAKEFTGIVSSDKTDKTIVVTVRARKTHPIYKKQYTTSKKFMAHDETNQANVGDKVVIAESKPLSARKRFTLVKVLEHAPIKHIEEEPIIEAAPLEQATTSRKNKVKTALQEEKK